MKSHPLLQKILPIVEQSPTTIVITDTQGIIEYVNSSFCELNGCTQDEYIGQSMKVVSSGSHPPEFIKAFWDTIKSGSTWKGEWCNKKRSGELYWAKGMASPLRDESGRITHFVEIKEDVTERKRIEKELKDHKENLEKLVKQKTIGLVAHQKELEMFDSAVSHDLKAPLRRINQFSEMLANNYTDQLDSRGKGFLKRIIDSGNQMEQLIESLLSLSEVVSRDMSSVPVDLSMIGKEISDQLQEEEPERDATIKIEDGMSAKGDESLLKDMLQNLLGNAWKYTSKNSQTKISFGKLKYGKDHAYFIQDNGAGFDMEYADKLFAPLKRLHRNDEFPGKGIGLATVQRIILRHEGRIWAESEVGKGSTFYFTL